MSKISKSETPSHTRRSTLTLDGTDKRKRCSTTLSNIPTSLRCLISSIKPKRSNWTVWWKLPNPFLWWLQLWCKITVSTRARAEPLYYGSLLEIREVEKVRAVILHQFFQWTRTQEAYIEKKKSIPNTQIHIVT